MTARTFGRRSIASTRLPWLSSLALALAAGGCDSAASTADDALDPADEIAAQVCTVPFEAGVRSGPNVGTELTGLLVFSRETDGELQNAKLFLTGGGELAVTGRISAGTITLGIALDAGTVAGTGTLDATLADDCGGRMVGPFTGPAEGDSGDWLAVNDLAATLRTSSTTPTTLGGSSQTTVTTRTYFAVPGFDGASFLYRQDVVTVTQNTIAGSTVTYSGSSEVTLAIGGLNVGAFTPTRLLLTRESHGAADLQTVIWIADATHQRIFGLLEDGDRVDLIATIDQAAVSAASVTLGFGPLTGFKPRSMVSVGRINSFTAFALTDEANHVVWTVDRTKPEEDVSAQLHVGLGVPGAAGQLAGLGTAARLTAPARIIEVSHTLYPSLRLEGLQPDCQYASVSQRRVTGAAVPNLQLGFLSPRGGCVFEDFGVSE